MIGCTPGLHGNGAAAAAAQRCAPCTMKRMQEFFVSQRMHPVTWPSRGFWLCFYSSSAVWIKWSVYVMCRGHGQLPLLPPARTAHGRGPPEDSQSIPHVHILGIYTPAALVGQSIYRLLLMLNNGIDLIALDGKLPSEGAPFQTFGLCVPFARNYI